MTLPNKPSPTAALVSEQSSTNSLLIGTVSRLASLQRLPHHFLSALRTKELLAKKDVASINEWMFMKLKEHMQGDIDTENESYERYTQNVGLLEEIFCPTEDVVVEPNTETTSTERMDMLVSKAKVRLRSDTESADRFKERIASILSQKLKKLLESQSASEDQSPSDQSADDHTEVIKLTTKQKMERTEKVNEILGKMSRVRSENDLKPCRDIMVQLFGNENDSSMDKSNRMGLLPSIQESSSAATPPYPFRKLCTRIEVDDDFASKHNDEFASLDQIAQL